MLTRLAIFEGRVKPGQEAAMRTYVEAELVPLWRQFQPSEEVRILYAAEAGNIPLVLGCDVCGSRGDGSCAGYACAVSVAGYVACVL